MEQRLGACSFETLPSWVGRVSLMTAHASRSFYADTSKKKPYEKDRPPFAALLVRWTLRGFKYGPGIRERRFREG